MDQYIEVSVKLGVEVDAAFDKDTLKSELEKDIRQVMYRAHITLAPYARKSVLDGVLPTKTEIISISEEAEIFGNDESKYRYYLFGKEVTDMYENRMPLINIKEELNKGGDVYLWDGVEVNDLLTAFDGWLDFQEITKEEYVELKRAAK